jgi:RHS repeat-associated protein
VQTKSESFTYGPEGVIESRVGTAAPTYPLADNVGTLVGSADDSGAFTGAPELDPFGELIGGQEPTGVDDSTLGFAGASGRESLPYSDLVKMGAREYDPESGSFITRDPVTGGASEPARRASYSYAFNAPARFVDLDGRSVLGDGWNTVKHGVDVPARYIEEWAASKTNDPHASVFVKGLGWVIGPLSALAASENLGETLMAFVPGPGKLKGVGKAAELGIDAARGAGATTNLSNAVVRKLGGLADRADEKVADVLLSRGGGGKQIRKIESGFGELTLKELAELDLAGDEAAKTAMKIVKQAGKQKKGGK